MVLYVIPRRVAWFDTIPGRVDALATMSLIQMISDAYEDTHDMWQHDDDTKPDSPSPNGAQKTVRTWLAYARFLPPLPPNQLPASDPLCLKPQASSSTISNPPKTRRKWSISLSSLKLSRQRTLSGSTNLPSPSRSLFSLSPSKLWRRRRESTSSFTTISEASSLSTPPSTPSTSSSRSLPVRPYTTPTYKKRPRFPTKIPHRQESTSDDVQVSPSPQNRTRTQSLGTLQSVCHPSNNISTHRSTRSLSFNSTTPPPWLTRSFLSPSLNSSPSSFELPLPCSAPKPVLDKDLSEDRAPDVTLLTIFIVTMLGYLFFFFLFLCCLVMAICKLLGICWGTNE